MRRMGIVRLGMIFVVLLLGVGLLTGCSTEQGFEEILRRTEGVAIFDRVLMEGGDVLTFAFVIESDMMSPELRANWTLQNREVFIDLYVIPQADYDPNLDPPDQPNIFWTSVPEVGPEFGESRGTSVALHPCVFDDEDPPVCRPEGAWVLLFHNGQLRTPANNTLLTATVNLVFFQ